MFTSIWIEKRIIVPAVSKHIQLLWPVHDSAFAQPHQERSSFMDRNFDGIAPRFTRNIYNSAKGQLRLAVLRRDFAEFLPMSAGPLHILDAGGGQGQLALELASAGHCVTLTDVSSDMLALAQAALANCTAEVQERVTIVQAPLQALADHFAGQTYDLVMCHAVIEWLNEPEHAVTCLAPLVKPGGWYSLVFYNLEGMIFKNLLRTNFKKIQQQDYKGFRGSLTPTNPLRLAQIREWVTASGLAEVCCSGIRVFHDYIFNADDRKREPDVLEQMELEFSRQLPYRDLGRYVHVLCRKPSET
jgi:S-adenosylmethionine-dependent methyltransferase